MPAFSYSYRNKKTGVSRGGTYDSKSRTRRAPTRRVKRRYIGSPIRNLFPRVYTGKFQHFKDLPTITVPASSSLRRVWFNSIAPYSTTANATALSSYVYQQSPANPDTYCNGIPQYSDIYGLANVLWSKLYMEVVNVQNSATGTTLNLSMVLVPISPETEALAPSIELKVNALDGYTFSQLASLKGAKASIIGHAAGGPNKWVCSSRILTKAYLGVKDVVDDFSAKERLPDSDTLQAGLRASADKMCGYYFRIFNNTATDTSVSVIARYTSIVKMTQLNNSGQQIIQAP